MNKRILGTILGVFVLALLVTASPVMAAEVDVTASNEETGAESDNENEVEVENEGDVDVTNDGDVNNEADANVNTGDNEQNMNTTGGELRSGAVNASTDWESVINDGYGLCGCPFGDEDHSVKADFSNRLTGYDSDNENSLEVDNSGDVNVRNVADVLNRLGLSANTGDNEMNMNTTGGDMETGSVGVEAGISNWANVVDGGSSDGGSTTIDVTASNEETGAESDNENSVEIENSGDKTVRNTARLNNHVDVRANTGRNEMNQNTTGGQLTTGDVAVSTDIQNVANTGGCCPTGSNNLDVSADLSNETTGYQSDNENEVEIENDGDTTLTNTADVDNDLNVRANTGDNEQNKNTTGGGVETGSVSIDFGSTTVVNSSN